MPNWFEQLPDKCPPNDAFEPDGGIYYRLINSNEPESNDFISKRSEMPLAVFKDIEECIARAVSIFANKQDCDKMTKFPRHKNKTTYQLILKNTDGLLKKTFDNSHYSWWRSNNFQIEEN